MDSKYRWLRFTMLLGGLYDLIFSIPILFLPEKAGTLLNIKCPENPFYVKFCGLFIFILSIGYFIAYSDIEKGIRIVLMMIISRFLGFVFMIYFALFGGMVNTFIYLALFDLSFSVAHTVLLRKKM
ncbi:MAG: hypothetical protein DRH44_00310 [Candidatus Coatesbacteria bacterium]|nr:MAG: hypothetical protein DRH44_00310 [Candidatus Coatesbacteria bacterium]